MPSSFARRGLAARLLLAVALSLLLGGVEPGGGAATRGQSPPRNAAANTEDAAENGPSPDSIKLGLAAIKTRLDQGNFTPELLSDEMRQVTALRTAAGECQQIATDQLARVGQALAAVGDKQADETADLATTRQKIEAYKAQTEGRRAECRLHIVFADSLIGRIDAAQKNLLKERLARRGASIWDLALWNLQHAQVWSDAGFGAAAGAIAFGTTDAVGVVLVCLMLAADFAAGRGSAAGSSRLRRGRPSRASRCSSPTASSRRSPATSSYGRRSWVWRWPSSSPTRSPAS